MGHGRGPAGEHSLVVAFHARAKADLTVNGWDSYEATRLLMAAIRAGPNPTPEAVRDALETVRVPAMSGGTIGFDTHHLAHANAVVLTLRQGKTVLIGMSNT